MKHLKPLFVLALVLLASSAFAGTFSIPEKRPLVSVDIPDSWNPEITPKGVACESPDQVASIFFDVVGSEKGARRLIEENVDWLVKDQGVRIDAASQKERSFETNGFEWSEITWDGVSDEWGPASIGFLMTMVSENKMLISTYWITKKHGNKRDARLDRMIDSIRPVRK